MMRNRALLEAIVELPQTDRWAAICELGLANARNYPAIVVARRIWSALADKCAEHGIADDDDWAEAATERMAEVPASDNATVLLGEYDRRQRAAWLRRQQEKEPEPNLRFD